MKEGCVTCKVPLAYMETDTVMECAVCHKKEASKTRCVKGHYVCNECHIAGSQQSQHMIWRLRRGTYSAA